MIDPKLLNKFIKVCERAAFGASKFKGKNDKVAADKAAVDEMRSELNKIDIRGKVVIGEGEMDEAPMLYIGEKVGTGKGENLEIAVDPLEGTNFAAKNLPNAISVMAVAKKGCLLSAPDTYMEKIAIGSGYPDNIIDLDNSVEKNIELIAKAKGTKPENLTACVLKRSRHDKIISSLMTLKVKIKFIDDGDVTGVISVVDINSPIDIYLGIGGGPEGVLAAAALDTYNCNFQGRFLFETDEDKVRAKKMGINDLTKKYELNEIVLGDSIFCATGITSGDLVAGVKIEGNEFISETLVTHKSSGLKKVIKLKQNF